jgi:hypothetical protein
MVTMTIYHIHKDNGGKSSSSFRWYDDFIESLQIINQEKEVFKNFKFKNKKKERLCGQL